MFSKFWLKRLIGTALVLVAALAIPASYSPAEGVVLQEACASGGCCYELWSICDGNPGYYLNRTGDRCTIRSVYSSPTIAEPTGQVES